MESNEEKEKGFDVFELLTALLLGLAATGAAVAGLQAGQWGGKQLDAFSEANTLTTKAATVYTELVIDVNADYQAVGQAKGHILEARDATDPKQKQRHYDLASYYYSTQMTEDGYEAMELPTEFFVEDQEDGGPAPKPAAAPTPAATPPPAATTPPPAGAAEEDEEDAVPGLARDIPDAALLASLETELDDAYVDEMLKEGNDKFKEADAKFAEGRVANENGDKFDLVGVYFTVALFFAGLGLVFKTSTRWAFFAMGTLVFVGSTIYMATLPWAG